MIYGVPCSSETLHMSGGVVARDPETIQREIEKTRDSLADSLDALGDRAHPKHLVDAGKKSVLSRLEDPRIRYGLIAVGVVLAFAALRKLFR